MAILRIINVLLITIIGFILSSKLIYAQTDPYNFIPNYSFEEGIDFPNSWSVSNEDSCGVNPVSGPQANVEWNHSLAKTGTSSVGFKDIAMPDNFKGDFITSIVSETIEVPSPIAPMYLLNGGVKGTNSNRNLWAKVNACFYNSSEKLLYKIEGGRLADGNFWYGLASGGRETTITQDVKKIKFALSISCSPTWFSPSGCRGSMFFDDIVFKPIGNITAHKFEDKNQNMIKDQDEVGLAGWQISFHGNFDCDDSKIFALGITNQNGSFTMSDIPYGNYSLKETFWVHTPNTPPFWVNARTLGWTNTTPLCQNVTLNSTETPIVNFGNVQLPTFPYFSQKDPAWGGQEYDSANTYGPFFCGTTLAQCGCATTSSAMLLKYYGVNKSPTGEDTNPQTLNNWLKANNGYAFGALKWNSIAAYSVKANQIFTTQQKIKFSGVAPSNDFTTLNQDLNNNSPPILQEPGHFIVATGIQNPTYTIADPAWQNKTTLAAYSDSFQSLRRFAKTNTDLSAIYIAAPAPTGLLITDSQGRKTGKDADGNTYNQIPNSYYALEPAFSDQSAENPQAPPENLGVNTLVILTPEGQNLTLETFSQTANYSIEFSSYDEDGDITVQGFDQTKADRFDIEYTEGGNQFEFFQTVDIDARHAAKSNPFNPKAHILPLSILASEDFYPQSADINTIDAGPNWSLLKTSSILVGSRSESRKSLLLLFENSGNYEDEICIRGKTLGGLPFRGCDTITVIGNGP